MGYQAFTVQCEGEENAYSKHNVFWTERDANNKAYDYFQRHGYLHEWLLFDYPL